jgi:hypothetical protein
MAESEVVLQRAVFRSIYKRPNTLNESSPDPRWAKRTAPNCGSANNEAGGLEGTNETGITHSRLGRASSGNVLAQDKLVKIGVLTDLSGLYSDFAGQGSTLAAEMAIYPSENPTS